MNTVPTPALRYYGSKWRLADWIIDQFPPHVCYVEPFGGSASVLLQKPPSLLETYNDLSEDIVNFFRVLREQTNSLIRAIQLTPFARAEVLTATKMLWRETDPLERARLFYVLSWQTYRGGGMHHKYKGSWRFQRSWTRGSSVVYDWNRLEHLYAIAERLKNVQVENDDAISVIRRFDAPTTLFYCDPPYLAETRTPRWQNNAYHCEMGSEEEHRRLAEVLHDVQGMVIISGYPSKIYDDELYPGWKHIHREAVTIGKKKGQEYLWISPQAESANLPLLKMIQEQERGKRQNEH